uniref:Cytochrome b n=1 Tax=Xibalbanus tulumensis TaxID=1519145 RepID=Q6SKY1_XIBTU|nr:cytochrome b [Xibalbanus tulumensis]AAS00892.1 apocytochrome b [Xibalbanus tulumensis]
MTKPARKSHPLLKIMNNLVIDLPTPINISYMWNFGSLLGLCLATQMATGIMLSMHYTPHIDMAFSSIDHISRDVNSGWILRNIHSNMASMFFLFIYSHTARNIYFSTFHSHYVWNTGIIMLFTLMATAFMGYVLPWGQMSFWGATVITNLLSAVPYIGKTMVNWLWGGFSLNNATLNRFFSIHFTLPFLLIMMMMIHVMFLHQAGSSNPLGFNSNTNKVPFHPYFLTKDLLWFITTMMALILLSTLAPNLLMDPENFNKANPMMTPPHIQPEWYFLFAYAILRSIPNKLGGVVALVMSVLILMSMPLLHSSKFKPMTFYPPNQILFWSFMSISFLLTWIGARTVEEPYIITGQILTAMYFMFFMMSPMIMMMWDKMLK